MDTQYKNSTFILDNSFWRTQENLLVVQGVNIYDYYQHQGISFMASKQIVQENNSYNPNPDLFSGAVVFSNSYRENSTSTTGFVFSPRNNKISTTAIDPNGYPIAVVDVVTTTISESDTYIISKIGTNDYSVLLLARAQSNSGSNYYVATNDGDMVKFLNAENHPIVRPTDLLQSLQRSGFMTYQKTWRVIDAWQNTDPQWLPKNSTYSTIIKSE